jgi:hypothetical protein
MNQVRDWVVRDWVIVQVRWRFRERVYDQVRDQDWKRVDLQVCRQVRDQVWMPVWMSVEWQAFKEINR